MERDFSGKRTDHVFDGQREHKLGTPRRPAVVRVQTKKRHKEVASLFEKHGWSYEISVDPDEPEDTADLEVLLHPQEPAKAETKVGRNDPCPCGSGKKYKKCCEE